ncbi:hypothetical protein D9M72_580740 [compost metagenome]
MDEVLLAEGISYNTFLDLQEVGIVTGVEALGLNTTFDSVVEETYLRLFRCGNHGLLIEAEDPKKKLSLEVYILTKAGRQILSLCEVTPNIENLERVGATIAKKGFTVHLVKWFLKDDKSIRCEHLKKLGDDEAAEIEI